MHTYAVYLTPRGALASWPLTSDTLFGAVCWGIRLLGLQDDEQLSEWLRLQESAPLFALSHAFPFYRSKVEEIRFYPRPANFQPVLEDFDELASQQKADSLKFARARLAEAGKRLRKLAYVSEKVISQISSDKIKPADGLRALLFPQNSLAIKAGALCTVEEAKQLPQQPYENEAVQHNHIDRWGGATVEGLLFYRNEVYFAPHAGLWAMLRCTSDNFEKLIHPALRYLADTGFGADRTAGKGQFDIQVVPYDGATQQAKPRSMMSLSCYLPLQDDFDFNAEPLAYSLRTLHAKREKKYPRTSSIQHETAPIYKQPIRVFEPGSVFALKSEKAIYGRLARVTPPGEEVVYQSGAALMYYL